MFRILSIYLLLTFLLSSCGESKPDQTSLVRSEPSAKHDELQDRF